MTAVDELLLDFARTILNYIDDTEQTQTPRLIIILPALELQQAERLKNLVTAQKAVQLEPARQTFESTPPPTLQSSPPLSLNRLRKKKNQTLKKYFQALEKHNQAIKNTDGQSCSTTSLTGECDPFQEMVQAKFDKLFDQTLKTELSKDKQGN
jgi:hypothetical protein